MRVRCQPVCFAVCSAASRESAEEMLLHIHSNSCFCQPLLKDNAPIVVWFRKRHYKTSNCDRFLVVHVSFFPCLGPTHRGLKCWTWVMDDPHVCVGRRIWLGTLWWNLYLRLLSGGLGLSGRHYCYKPTLDSFRPRWSADWSRFSPDCTGRGREREK